MNQPQPRLSPRLNARLTGLLGRIFWLRLLRGLSFVAITLALLAGIAFAFDSLLGLSASTRTIVRNTWAGLGVLLALVQLPSLIRLPRTADVAALIEQRYPELAERLSSSLELQADESIDPALLDRLLRETESQTAGLSLMPVLPTRRTASLAVLASLTLALVVAPAFAWTAYRDLAERFFWPAGTPVVAIGYRLDASAHAEVVRKGSPVTVSAALTTLREGSDLPREAFLIHNDGSRTAMTAGPAATFTVEVPAKTDLRLRVEAGALTSDEIAVRLALPVELAPEQPVFTIAPPAYAAVQLETDVVKGIVAIEGLRHSTLTVQAEFTRPANRVALCIQPANGDPIALPLTLDEDGKVGTLTTPLTVGGTYSLVTVSRDGLEETIRGDALTLRADRAPEVLDRERRFPGLGRSTALTAGQTLNLGFEADDDFAVAGAWIEWANSADPAQTLPINLAKIGPTTVRGTLAMPLPADTARSGGKLRYRVRLEDNRPKEFGGPNVTYFPAKDWLEVTVKVPGESTGQDILTQRDSLNLKLSQLIDDLARQWRATNKLKQETREQAKLDPNQREQLRELEKQVRETKQELEKLVRDHQDEPGLQPLIEKIDEVRKQPIEQAEKALKEAGNPDRPAQPRDGDLARADRNLDDARRKLEAARDLSNDLARNRLDQARAEQLAREQEKLAEQTRELAKQNDPPTKEELATIEKKQAELAKELERLTKESPALQEAAKQLQPEQLQNLGKQAEDLARQQRELAKQQEESAKNPLIAKLADLAKKQEELAKKQAELARTFDPKEAREATEALKRGDARNATDRQDQAAKDLEKLARDVERAAEVARAPRDAAARTELARLQAQQEAAAQLAKQADRGTPTEREQKLAEAAKKQAETAEALSKLNLPEQADRLAQARAAADRALRDLLDRNKVEIAGSQDEIKKQLDRLAKALRGEKSPEEKIAELARQQRELAREAEALAKQEQPKKDEVERLKKKQKDIADQASKLPASEADRARQATQQAETAQQMKQAADELDRLFRRVDDSETPAEKAERLAREQAQNPDARKQGELARELDRLPASPEKEKARDAVKQAEQAKPEDRAQAQEKAADALKELARKLEKPEPLKPDQPTPRQQATELARKQREIEKATTDAQAEQASKGPANRPTYDRKMEDLSRQQQDLNRQASQLPAEGNQKGLEQARGLMNQTRDLLEKKEAGNAAVKAGQASRELQKLAQQLPDKQPEQARNDPQPQQQPPAMKQADEARRLAQEQRELRDRVAQATEQTQQARQQEQQKSATEQARQQGEIAKQTEELAKKMSRDKADPHAAEKAAEAMKRGEAEKAAEQLKELAQQMEKAGNAEGKKQAEDLAQRQQELARQMQQTPAGQQARQENLQQKGNDLMQQLKDLAGKMQGNQPGQQAAQEAAKSGEQAKQAMQRAAEQSKQGNEGQAQQSREEAARNLEQASKQAMQAGREASARQPMPGEGSAEALRQAREQTQKAGQELRQQSPQQAGNAMQQAAQALQQLAQQMQPQNPNQPGANPMPPTTGAAPGGLPNADALPPELQPYAGRTWGELPGELRTRILQEARGRYGDDYARMIKLYFEQLATQRPKR